VAAFHHPELDSLRFFAFLLVFVHHAIPDRLSAFASLGWLAPWGLAAVRAGAFGVDLFFCLSAYLITELLLREKEKLRQIDVRAFYLRRILRIWPLYYGALVVAVFIPSPGLPAKYAGAFALLAGNWSVAAWGYPSSWVTPLWSVSIEEQFYLVWPLVVSRLDERRLKTVAVGLLVTATLTRLALAALNVRHPAVWTDTLARLDPIAIGALIALTLRGESPQLSRSTRLGLLGLAPVALIVVALVFGLDGWTSLVTYPLVALTSLGLILATLGGGAALPMLRLPALQYLGRISYGLYVFHRLALDLSRIAVGRGFPYGWLRPFVALAMTMAIAALSYRWLEFPFLRLKQRFTRVQSRPEPSAP